MLYLTFRYLIHFEFIVYGIDLRGEDPIVIFIYGYPISLVVWYLKKTKQHITFIVALVTRYYNVLFIYIFFLPVD